MASAQRVSFSAPFAYAQIAFLVGFAAIAGIELGHTLARTLVGLALIAAAGALAWRRLPNNADEAASGVGMPRIPKES
jgi:hypothetical protein